MARAEREQYYKRIGANSLAPLWEVLHNLVPREPPRTCQPHVWHYDRIRDQIMEAGELITAKEAERRVLVLENPGLKGSNQVTPSLYAGLQLILPGEIAASHRHTQSALRFVIEGKGAYTAVDGERTIMSEGDFVITPPWTWHDHGNESERPMVWMDGLDVPLVNYLDAGFAEKYPEEVQPLDRPEGDALARYGTGLLPDGYESGSLCSPVFNYPYDRTREALETMRRTEKWDPCHGLKMKYVNPVDGGWAMPTMATSIQLLPGKFASVPYRSTDATVFSAVEGSGRTVVGDVVLEWGPRDVFVIPAWVWHHVETDGDSVLFSFSNRPVQEKLGLFREQRGNEET
jgi:gentisate 1,2-dioxygenase